VFETLKEWMGDEACRSDEIVKNIAAQVRPCRLTGLPAYDML
jgi:hypothetical protein